MSGLREDLRIAWRHLIGRPAATSAAIAALALGIGFSTANYSVADALLFHPLPIPEIGRVLVVGMRSESNPKDFRSVPASDYFLWASSARTVSAVAADRLWYSTLTGAGEPLQVTGARVTASFFDVMRIRPSLGRFFGVREEAPGDDNSVVLSHRFWVRQFAADPGIVGHSVELNGRKFTVVGVLPQGFNYPRAADFLVPLALTPEARADAASFYLKVSARLRDGASIEQAREEFSSFARSAAVQYPDSHSRVTTRVVPLRERASGEHAAGYTRIMIAAVLFLLLIACLNVANLQLARIVSRSREMAVRAALGASRLRIARQVLVEGLMLSAAGAGLGVLLAAWVLDFIRASMPPEVERFLPGWRQLGLNPLVLFYTVLTALAAGVFSSLAPVFWLNRISVAGSLHEAGRASTATLSRQRLRTGLVVLESVLAVVLLIGAGLMARSFQAIGAVSVAFDPDQALTFRLALPEARYPGAAAAARFQQALLENLQTLPGVRRAAVVTNLPGSGSNNSSFITVEGRPAERGPGTLSQTQSVSSGYFQAFGLRLLEGRFFTPSDGPDSAPVAVVSQAFARHFFPAGSPLGRRVHLGDGRWITIIGVASDILHDYTERFPTPLVYRPNSQFTWNSFDVILDAPGDASTLAPAAREAVYAVDPVQPIHQLRTYQKLLSDNLFGIAYVAANLTVLGAVALFMSMLGVYSVMAFVVGERTREFGVRLALGAARANLLWMVMRSGLAIAGVSLALGLPAAYAVVRLLQGFIYGISPFDPATFLGMPATLAVALVSACLLPAWRACRTDPLVALRNE